MKPGRLVSFQGLPAFIARVVNRLTANIRQIHELGVRRILVSNLAPLGCLPAITVSSSYRQCNGTLNVLVTYHNQLLQQAVALLNRHGSDDKLPAPSANFTLIDLFTSFSSSLNAKGINHCSVNWTFQTVDIHMSEAHSGFIHLFTRESEVWESTEAVLHRHERGLQLWERGR